MNILTEEEFIQIKAANLSLNRMTQLFHISKTTAQKIKLAESYHDYLEITLLKNKIMSIIGDVNENITYKNVSLQKINEKIIKIKNVVKN